MEPEIIHGRNQNVRYPMNPINYYGKTVGRLGKGTYGVVMHRRKETPAGREDYAVKSFINIDEGDNDVPTDALREIAILRRVNHPNIVRMLDFVIGATDLKLIMPLAVMSLSDFLKKPDYSKTFSVPMLPVRLTSR